MTLIAMTGNLLEQRVLKVPIIVIFLLAMCCIVFELLFDSLVIVVDGMFDRAMILSIATALLIAFELPPLTEARPDGIEN